jgi:predicted metal-binding transcription factor (methanogenesis marker protein 9)
MAVDIFQTIAICLQNKRGPPPLKSIAGELNTICRRYYRTKRRFAHTTVLALHRNSGNFCWANCCVDVVVIIFLQKDKKEEIAISQENFAHLGSFW